jgi:hypothetical protein
LPKISSGGANQKRRYFSFRWSEMRSSVPYRTENFQINSIPICIQNGTVVFNTTKEQVNNLPAKIYVFLVRRCSGGELLVAGYGRQFYLEVSPCKNVF